MAFCSSVATARWQRVKFGNANEHQNRSAGVRLTPACAADPATVTKTASSPRMSIGSTADLLPDIQQVPESAGARTTTITETLPVPSPPTPQHAQNEATPTLRNLGRRLFTKGSWARAHAVPATILQFYSLPCTMWLWWRAAHGESITPSGAELLAVITLSYIKDVTAVPLAIRHRRGAEREAMVIAAFVDAAVWSFTLYLCAPLITATTGLAAPPLPPAARAVIFGALVLGGVISTVRPILTSTALVASNRLAGTRASARAAMENPDDPSSSARGRDLLSEDSATAGLYGLVQVIPGWSVIVGAGTVLFGGAEMRDWMVNIMPTGYGLFYGTAFCGAAAGSLGVFSATLYSRRVISFAQLSALNAVQISVYIGFLVSVYNADPSTYGEVMRVTQMRPFWLFNEAPWL